MEDNFVLLTREVFISDTFSVISIVNRVLPSLHRGSHEITHTVPLKDSEKRQGWRVSLHSSMTYDNLGTIYFENSRKYCKQNLEIRET